jgi:predicted alpha/beta superfamily hydrolase
VAKGAEHTAIGGASLGGLISIYAGAQRPDVFGAVLAESPTLSMRGEDLWKTTFGSLEKWPERMYVGVGGKEAGREAAAEADSKRFADAAKGFNAMLESKGLGPARRRFVFEPDASHAEDAWAGRFEAAVKFIFPTPADASK